MLRKQRAKGIFGRDGDLSWRLGSCARARRVSSFQIAVFVGSGAADERRGEGGREGAAGTPLPHPFGVEVAAFMRRVR